MLRERIIKKINRRFYRAYANYRFWYKLTERLASFQELLNIDIHDDKQTIYKIHSLLFKCYEISKDKRDFYFQKWNL